MKIIVLGINYAPEPTGIAPYNTGLCRFLKSKGHDVRMVTSFRYYPEWKKIADDRRKLYRTDVIDGVSVHRCWHDNVCRMRRMDTRQLFSEVVCHRHRPSVCVRRAILQPG